MLVCFYDMLTDFGDDFLNGSNYNFKKLQKLQIDQKLVFFIKINVLK